MMDPAARPARPPAGSYLGFLSLETSVWLPAGYPAFLPRQRLHGNTAGPGVQLLWKTAS